MSSVPGKGGNVPKRSDQVRRRNKPDHPIERAPGFEGEQQPADEAWHPAATRWYESLALSGQSVFFQQSDWETAWIWAELLSDQLSSSRRSAQMIQAWSAAASELLTTEGARRRLKIELDVAQPEGDGGDVSWIDIARQRKSGVSA